MNNTAALKFDNGVVLECIRGDITCQADVDVVVNAANAQLLPGGGVAGAIHARAGAGLTQECRALAPIRPGQSVITKAYDLPNNYVIHCLGPVYGVDRNAERLLASCYRGALNLAESHAQTSIAFPAISTGIFGYPLAEAAEIILSTISNFSGYKHIRLVRLVLWEEDDLKLFCRIMENLFPQAKIRFR